MDVSAVRGAAESKRQHKPPEMAPALSLLLEAFRRNNLGAASGVGNEEADIVVLSE